MIQNDNGNYWNHYYANVGFGPFKMLGADGCECNPCYTMKTIKTKVKEMTLEEIEKKLGHKVKIVNK
jgi:hypothetical protein